MQKQQIVFCDARAHARAVPGTKKRATGKVVGFIPIASETVTIDQLNGVGASG